MKRLLFLSVVCILLFSIMVTAKCGDNFCDSDEDCKFCPNDCLCSFTLETHEPSECCGSFDCQECEGGYCNEQKCDSLKAYRTMFKEAKCNSNGSISLQISFHMFNFEAGSGAHDYTAYIDANKEIKVFMKPDNKESSFKEIKGVWMSKDFNTNYPNRLKEEASFNSDLNVFDKRGKYWIRAKYQVGVSYNLYGDYLIMCYPEIRLPRQIR